MSVALPTLEVADISIARQTRRNLWERDFEENHRPFADDLALGIARHVIEELGNALKDPYKRTISFKKKLISNISLDLTKSRTANEIINFAQTGKELPPFNEWLTKFSTQQKQSEPYFDKREKDVDQQYFENLMAIVGDLAKIKLDEVLHHFRSENKHKDLQFKVEWFRREEQQFSSSSGFMDNCLLIELWFDDKVFPRGVEEKSSTTIEQHRVKQQKLQQIRMRNNIIAAMVVVIIGLLFLKSGVIKINLPQR